MRKDIANTLKPLWPALALSLTFVAAVFIWQSHTGLNLSDEGYLWYGAQRVMAGEVPMRDFFAYDIGRYYFSAAFMSLIGNGGIVSLRAASAIFQAFALFIGLTLLSRSCSRQNQLVFLVLAAITLTVWMPQQYRIYDNSLPIMLIGALAWLIDRPSRQRYFVAGLIVGVAAVFGKNHGVYGAIGSIGVMLYLTIGQQNGISLAKGFSFWVFGVCVGYLPVLAFIAFVPGYAQALWDSIRLLFEINATNIALPVHWPWLVPFGIAPLALTARAVLAGIFFMVIVAFGILGIAWLIRKKLTSQFVHPAVIAAVFMALPYAHYAYSRADIPHLISGMPPFLIGTLALLGSQPARIKWPFTGLLCATSLFLMIPTFPGWPCYASQQCIAANLVGDKVEIDKGTASTLALFSMLAERFAPGDQPFITAPFTPGIYAALQRKSPMWENYALFPRSNEFQQTEIARIEAAHPGFAVIHDFPLDERDELRFRNTHPLIDQYIRDHFEPVYGLVSNPSFQIFIRRETTP